VKHHQTLYIALIGTMDGGVRLITCGEKKLERRRLFVTLKGSLSGTQTDVGDPVFPKVILDLIPRIIYGWIQH
jgi:hypothetical protein